MEGEEKRSPKPSRRRWEQRRGGVNERMEDEERQHQDEGRQDQEQEQAKQTCPHRGNTQVHATASRKAHQEAEDPEDGEGGAPRKKMRMTTQRGRAVWLRAQGQVVLMTRTWGERASDNANKIDKKNAQNKIKYMQKWKGREEKPRATKDEDGKKGRQRRANE
ncbi:hypothetical protein C8J57DRAFT_1218356 [Mycena rebaudengoi]|nr:hypothetical protein C8J57DRAFT_1218356 [Mycena rebaudengoi]